MAYASPASNPPVRARAGHDRKRLKRFFRIALGLVAAAGLTVVLAIATLVVLGAFMVSCGCGPG